MKNVIKNLIGGLGHLELVCLFVFRSTAFDLHGVLSACPKLGPGSWKIGTMF